MNRYDYLKLELPSSEVVITNPNEFSHSYSKERVETHLRYKQKTPYRLEIIVDLNQNKTYISFTGKILLDDYPSLINISNIHTCFENINKTGVCYINPNTAIHNSVVKECDVTCDIPYDGNMNNLLMTLMLKSDYTISKKSSNRFYISTTYVTTRKGVTLVVYDKAQELRSSTNKPFLDSLSNREEIKRYYSDKLRLEMNLRSLDRIRKYLCCKDTCLLTLLNSSNDPIASFLNFSICSDEMLYLLITKAPRLRDLEHLLLLCICGFDLKKVERVVRTTTAKSTSITNNMKPYRAIYERIKGSGIDPTLDVDLSSLQTQIRRALYKAFDSPLSKIGESLYSLYNHVRKPATPSELDPLFIFNIPTVILPVLPD